jgi:inosine triphosphate pyrophosphatase
MTKAVKHSFPNSQQFVLGFSFSWRVLEISVAMAYAMLTSFGKHNLSLSAAAGMLRGYNSIYPLTEAEKSHLPILIACRLACSVTLGAYSYAKNPDNQYLLLHAEPAWKALEMIWPYDEALRLEMRRASSRLFEQACLYGATTRREATVTCYDLIAPDPCVADLLEPVRVRWFDVNDSSSPSSPITPSKKRKVGPSDDHDDLKNGAKPTITFVTGNHKKLEEVVRILDSGPDAPFRLTNKSVDLPELQGEPVAIAREKCLAAAEAVGGGVIIEDTSLCFNSLNGLPGPYIKWFLDKCGHDGLNNLLAAYEDKSAYAQTVVAFCKGPGHEPVVFDGRTTGTIVPPRGPLEFGWDPVFEPEGTGRTYAEMSKSEKDAISHRGRAFNQLRDYFRKFPADITG